MSCFALPNSICDYIKSLIGIFWWGGDDTSRKIHWVAWKVLCQSKSTGGIGFRSMNEFNEASLAKQGCHLIQNENSLLAKVLKERYYSRTSFLQAKMGHNYSYTWRSIVMAQRSINSAEV